MTIWSRALATNQCFSLSNAHMKVGDRCRFNNGTSTKINIFNRGEHELDQGRAGCGGSKGHVAKQLDADTEFLNSNLKEEVYMEVSNGIWKRQYTSQAGCKCIKQDNPRCIPTDWILKQQRRLMCLHRGSRWKSYLRVLVCRRHDYRYQTSKELKI